MPKKLYHILMQTPLGNKYGIMTVEAAENRIYGTMDILNHCEPFSGSVDKNGNCKIEGKLVTLMRTIKYIAVGKISVDTITLTLQGERNEFKISGVVCSNGKEPK